MAGPGDMVSDDRLGGHGVPPLMSGFMFQEVSEHFLYSVSTQVDPLTCHGPTNLLLLFTPGGLLLQQKVRGAILIIG
jgi:hypothetical protein